MKFSKEPIIWLAFVVVLGQTSIDFLDGGGFSLAQWGDQLLTALGALIGRQLVTPSIGTTHDAVDSDI